MTEPLRWSVMIPTYNCAHYLRETLESVLQQDPGPEFMQVEVVDDGSSDNPQAVVDAIGKGRVGFFRQVHNKGVIENLNTCIKRAKGELVHILHGDDRVLYGYYRYMDLLFADNPSLGAGFCRHYHVDEDGHQRYISPLLQKKAGVLPAFQQLIISRNQLQTPSMVVKKNTYDTIGSFDKNLSSMEDWDMWARIGQTYSVGFCPVPLAEYRVHFKSNTLRTIENGKSLQDLKYLLSKFQDYSKERTSDLDKNNDQIISGFIHDSFRTLFKQKDKKSAYKFLLKGISFQKKLPDKIKSVLLMVKYGIRH